MVATAHSNSSVMLTAGTPRNRQVANICTTQMQLNTPEKSVSPAAALVMPRGWMAAMSASAGSTTGGTGGVNSGCIRAA
jgi:hypothetical protein